MKHHIPNSVIRAGTGSKSRPQGSQSWCHLKVLYSRNMHAIYKHWTLYTSKVTSKPVRWRDRLTYRITCYYLIWGQRDQSYWFSYLVLYNIQLSRWVNSFYRFKIYTTGTNLIILFPHFRELWSNFISGHHKLHSLKCWVVPSLSLIWQGKLWHWASWEPNKVM